MEKSGKKSQTLEEEIRKQRKENKLNLRKQEIKEDITKTFLKDDNPLHCFNFSAFLRFGYLSWICQKN